MDNFLYDDHVSDSKDEWKKRDETTKRSSSRRYFEMKVQQRVINYSHDIELCICDLSRNIKRHRNDHPLVCSTFTWPVCDDNFYAPNVKILRVIVRHLAWSGLGGTISSESFVALFHHGTSMSIHDADIHLIVCELWWTD